MSAVAELLYSRRVPQVAVLALISFSFAGCSADMSSRLSQQNFSNPFASQESTGAVQQQPVQRELPQYARPNTQAPAYQSQPLPPPAVSAPQSYPVAGGVSGGGRGVGSYTPPAQPQLEATGAVPPRSVAAARPAGGTKIIVGTSDTLEVLAKRYHVTPAAILAANGYKGPRALSPGQQVIIPHQTAAAPAPAPAMAPVAAAPVMAAPVAAKPVAVVAAPSSTHFVNRGDTLASIARKNHVSVTELARANGLEPSAKLKLGTKLNVPGGKTAALAAPAPVAAAPVAVAQQPAAVATAPAMKVAALPAPQQSARLAQATANIEEKPAAEAPAKAAETTGALPTFRWPVRGKVVTGYGAKTNGKSNDGINVAVPEGTPVKAAEDGVVAYSGNELKGYGNLILVRHSNGYVTAYAHASELMVKRGDTIKRGQIIAKSGQSGEVASPQLHFEIRKGSNPVDPLQFLNGA
ncbi:LysM peptidoglycan-binding domain-containing M23 family metallopeptidase [Bradyrhizobium manausense]|uniref:LysM peptidoglycan-binding domain-containing M23 family metallopeptidase n=1 Tax=Bradyrhizobium TaxID=374 RepID=UPI001BAA9166|nr:MULTISPECIES: LysM peptidoglycan-binding domain-containing M23 family metallopeptidase [Bradyrhizobium]MBR0828259.1 LysM peptidoglycan-binding domain-containing M23 family metallopeptidase [Bradyrhizobium manausense]UVO25665.1 LysM peptidoglycan-binding domain-containing M23 family metallopeptidase [Bradyrhizobium arachidis]